jgi:hypothetical protein
MKVVINSDWGGFSLSEQAIQECVKRGMTITTYDPKGEPVDATADFVVIDVDRETKQPIHYPLGSYDSHEFRTHPTVLAVVAELGSAANGTCATLNIVDIPFDSLSGWEIENYDGKERIVVTGCSWR